MERKFISFSKMYDKYQKRLTIALEKLLFYMEVGGTHVDDQVLKKDIQFMEGSQMPNSSSNGNL